MEIILEDMDFAWETKDIDIVQKMWNDNKPINEIAKNVKREGDEVFLLLLHLSRQGYIGKRKGWIWGD